MKLTSFFRRIFDPKQRRRDLYCAAIIKRWKQNTPEVWRWNMLGLCHWGLVDKDDLAAMFTAKGLGPPRQNEFKPHHQDCTNLISWLVKQLVTWNAVMGEPVYEYPLEDFPPDAGKS